jgi:hypothetical protein
MKPDLNLLAVFDAVFRQGSVSRAADQLALSQPAATPLPGCAFSWAIRFLCVPDAG